MSGPVLCHFCGALSNDPIWCEHCGTHLGQAQNTDWLQIGDEVHFPNLSLSVQILEQKEAFSRRKIWIAQDAKQQRYLLEERKLRQGETVEKSQEILPLSKKYLFAPLETLQKDQRWWVLKPLAEGETLQAWRAKRTNAMLTPQRILHCLSPLFDALQEIHEQGFLHLNLHPESIYLNNGQVKFAELSQWPRPPFKHLHFKIHLGYSAPELTGRLNVPIDVRADVYAMGGLLYFLITGMTPPVSEESSFMPMLSPRDYRPDFPLGWEEIIFKAMENHPEQRFSSMAELRTVLESRTQEMALRMKAALPINLEGYAETHIGYDKQKRSPINQDHVFFAHDPALNLTLAVVADGVSTASYGSGDIASAFPIQRAQALWQKLLEQSRNSKRPLEINGDLIVEEIIVQSNRDIIEYINEHYAPFKGTPAEVMGSTVIVALIHNNTLILGSLGDSRAYLITEKWMECITRDHNLFTLGLVNGLWVEDALLMPQADALARCLGQFELNDKDHLISVVPEFDVYQIPLLPGDHLLICTDGLIDYIGNDHTTPEEVIKAFVLSEPHPGIAALELIIEANRGGGGDNIGIVSIKITEKS